MRNGVIVSLVGALVLAVLIGGCGEGGEEVTASLTKAEFVKKANEICGEAEKHIQSGLQKFTQGFEGNQEPTSPATVEAAQASMAETILLPARRQEVEEISALGVPTGEEDKVDAIITSLEKGVETVEADPASAVEVGGEPFGESSKLTRAYGLYGCA